MFIILMVFFTACNSSKQLAKGQECPYEYDKIAKREVMTFSEKMPEYPGGQIAILKYIHKKMTFDDGDSPFSFQLIFIIDNKGTLIKARINNKKRNQLTNSEKRLLRIMESMPSWSPGECQGNKVYTKMSLSIRI